MHLSRNINSCNDTEAPEIIGGVAVSRKNNNSSLIKWSVLLLPIIGGVAVSRKNNNSSLIKWSVLLLPIIGGVAVSRKNWCRGIPQELVSRYPARTDHFMRLLLLPPQILTTLMMNCYQIYARGARGVQINVYITRKYAV